MSTEDESAGDEPLRCPHCGADAFNVTLSKGGVLKLVCASCRNPIGYSSDLMRVLVKRA